MSFEEFTNYIRDHITEGWNESASVSIQKIKKNNGIVYTGAYIRSEGSMVTPAIYLEAYYKRLQEGESPEELLLDIRKEFDWAMSRTSSFEFDISSYANVRDRLIYRLINYEKNKELLMACPHIRLEDLAVTFRWLAHEDSVGISTALVTYNELELWDVTVQDILLAARENTERIFPRKVMYIEDFFMERNMNLLHDERSIPMYVATNQQQINGASVILYDHFLEDFEEEHPGNYYILPSSIHELILIPEDSIQDPDSLCDIVAHANSTVVSDGDILSDSVYYYNADSDSLSIYKR